jgi:hypothetical protein
MSLRSHSSPSSIRSNETADTLVLEAPNPLSPFEKSPLRPKPPTVANKVCDKLALANCPDHGSDDLVFKVGPKRNDTPYSVCKWCEDESGSEEEDDMVCRPIRVKWSVPEKKLARKAYFGVKRHYGNGRVPLPDFQDAVQAVESEDEPKKAPVKKAPAKKAPAKKAPAKKATAKQVSGKKAPAKKAKAGNSAKKRTPPQGEFKKAPKFTAAKAKRENKSVKRILFDTEQ